MAARAPRRAYRRSQNDAAMTGTLFDCSRHEPSHRATGNRPQQSNLSPELSHWPTFCGRPPGLLQFTAHGRAWAKSGSFPKRRSSSTRGRRNGVGVLWLRRFRRSFSRRPAGRRACSAAPRHVEPMTHGDAPYRACAPPDAVPCPDRRSGRASMHRQPGIGRCCEGHPGRLHRRSNPLVRQWRMPAQTIAV